MNIPGTKWEVLYEGNRDGMDISIGKWNEQDEIYFTVRGLKPYDIVGSDLEFGMSIPKLYDILAKAGEKENKEFSDKLFEQMVGIVQTHNATLKEYEKV
ncbi:MAG: hypothetical protein Q7J27_14585 [Syntrophales bacterium]|nr:hypothetical protein [Syntrophales bacterium]